MEHSNPRTQIREGIEGALGGIAKVWHYRMMPFNMDEIPAINILPETDSELETSLRNNNWRETETFRVELAIARESDEQRFADYVDALYLQVKRALLKMKTCVKCPKVHIQRRMWAVDDRGQVPLIVIRFFVAVEFDGDTD
jgi:hypothetical protein